MAEIKCYADTCKYWQEGNYCSCIEIEINEYSKCDSYVYYKESEKWQTLFWKSMHDAKDKNKIGRVKYFGKEIEIEGRIFYVEGKSSFSPVTDKETGRYCGELWEVNNPRFVKKIAELAKNYPPVMSLPIAKCDKETRELIFIEEHEDKNEQ